MIVDGSVSEDAAREMARTLTSLAHASWRTYTHPASAAMDDLSPNTLRLVSGGCARRARQGRRDNTASQSLIGRIDPSVIYSGGGGRARTRTRVARYRFARAGRGDCCRSRGGGECNRSAESGTFAGRSAQAILLTRAEASPGQVAAADELLSADPLGSRELQTRLHLSIAKFSVWSDKSSGW